jgi:hypothetical protein
VVEADRVLGECLSVPKAPRSRFRPQPDQQRSELARAALLTRQPSRHPSVRADLKTWLSGIRGGVSWRSGRVERDSSTVSDPSAGTRQRLRRPLAVGGLSLADLIGGATWRSDLAEWASRTGLIDGFRSECRNSAAASPAAGLWRSQLGGLSLAHLIGGATWRSGLAVWAGRTGFIDGFRSECRNSAAASPAAGGLSLAPFAWRTSLAE